MGEEKQKSTPKFTYGNNYRRTRRETQFDTLDMAVSLKHKVSVYVMNDRYVPKRWRYINGKPAIDYARAIRDCISDSTIYFSTKNKRLKDYQQEHYFKKRRYRTAINYSSSSWIL